MGIKSSIHGSALLVSLDLACPTCWERVRDKIVLGNVIECLSCGAKYERIKDKTVIIKKGTIK